MILFTFENDKNTAIKTEAFTSAREQFTCSDVIPTCPIELIIHKSLFSSNFCVGCEGYDIFELWTLSGKLYLL